MQIDSGRAFRCCSAVTLLLAIIYLAACSNDISSAPPVDLPFTIYGNLNPTQEQQAVVVFPVKTHLRPSGREPLDAVLTSTDLQESEVRVWRDSLVWTGERGYDHLFYSDFRAEYGRTYRIEVTRSDGARSRAEVRVPQQVTIDQRDDGAGNVEVYFRGAGVRPLRVFMDYRVRQPCWPPAFTYTLDYTSYLRKEGDTWVLKFELDEFSWWIASWYVHSINFEQYIEPVDLLSLTMRFSIGDEGWEPPGGNFDARVLSHPGIMNNVENGFGFVGAGYRGSTFLTPSPASVRSTEYFLVPVPRVCPPVIR